MCFCQADDSVYQWLISVRLERYYRLFADAGYDLPTISRMTPEVRASTHASRCEREITGIMPQCLSMSRCITLSVGHVTTIVGSFRELKYDARVPRINDNSRKDRRSRSKVMVMSHNKYQTNNVP